MSGSCFITLGIIILDILQRVKRSLPVDFGVPRVGQALEKEAGFAFVFCNGNVGLKYLKLDT